MCATVSIARGCIGDHDVMIFACHLDIVICFAHSKIDMSICALENEGTRRVINGAATLSSAKKGCKVPGGCNCNGIRESVDKARVVGAQN